MIHKICPSKIRGWLGAKFGVAGVRIRWLAICLRLAPNLFVYGTLATGPRNKVCQMTSHPVSDLSQSPHWCSLEQALTSFQCLSEDRYKQLYWLAFIAHLLRELVASFLSMHQDNSFLHAELMPNVKNTQCQLTNAIMPQHANI